MRVRGFALAAAVSLVLPLVVLSGQSEAAPIKYEDLKRVHVALVWANIRGQYGRAWPLLHPRYQRVTTRAFWEECQRRQAQGNPGIEWLSIRAIDAYADRVTVPLLGRVSVVAVSIEAKYEYLGATRTARDTLYWTKVNGKWRGLWKPEQYRAYRAKRCPT